MTKKIEESVIKTCSFGIFRSHNQFMSLFNSLLKHEYPGQKTRVRSLILKQATMPKVDSLAEGRRITTALTIIILRAQRPGGTLKSTFAGEQLVAKFPVLRCSFISSQCMLLYDTTRSRSEPDQLNFRYSTWVVPWSHNITLSPAAMWAKS